MEEEDMRSLTLPPPHLTPLPQRPNFPREQLQNYSIPPLITKWRYTDYNSCFLATLKTLFEKQKQKVSSLTSGEEGEAVQTLDPDAERQDLPTDIRAHRTTPPKWMDGWMDGQTDGWMDGWAEGRTDRQDKQNNISMHGQASRQRHR
ncbi:unnamed protein product [Pleuronectes platessa]|uniref:Uncharacterized protein n=1 Tax=Pleuronectes platessa TaxID=8262 RepID=A0A9N7VGY8_PLEPL|nr:unnamed protein product [Pleuronectes platessa]